jgi:peptide/nickel transport system substrate-binding protein
MHEALFDTLYTRDERGNLTPSLAEGDPVFENGFVNIPLRSGLRSAAGKELDARDVVFAIERARKSGARALLSDVPAAWLQRGGIGFATKDAAMVPRIHRALASPLTALVPRGFDPDAPDGTGPFRLRRRGDGFVLLRNPFASRGAAFLDEVALWEAPDLSTSLRAFETGRDDLGWMGSGLHEPRPGAKPFDFGAVAHAVLFTGKDLGTWDAPGVAQRICDSLPPARLSYLALGSAWSQAQDNGWAGPPTTILVREDSAWMVELARAIAATLTRPDHEVTVRTSSDAEVVRARQSRAFGLLLDVVRPMWGVGTSANVSFSWNSMGMYAALILADNPSTAGALWQRAPRLGADVSARSLTRTLRVGVVGDVRVTGARAPDLSLAGYHTGGFDLGATTKVRK